MTKKITNWKKGRGKLGVMQPLLGAWQAEADSPMGKFNCIRSFRTMLGGKYIELKATWEFSRSTYEEQAVFGFDGKTLTFWSFTSDGKRSQGQLSKATDVHKDAICFEAQMP